MFKKIITKSFRKYFLDYYLLNLLIFKMAATWNVKLTAQGRTMNVTVQAGTQPEARKIAEHQYPGYKAVTAQRA